MLATPMIQLLERFLNVTSDRESLIANNMANIDTPGYRTEDLDFRSELQRATGNSEDAAFTPVVRKVPGLLQRPDGNDVSLDRESMNLAESQLQFKMGIQFIRSEFHRLLNAINEGKDA
jgi:flagellar basal-body rod protein FlgB